MDLPVTGRLQCTGTSPPSSSSLPSLFLPLPPTRSSFLTSVKKFGGTTKTGRHRSRQFLKNSVKIGEISRNAPEMQTNTETGNTDKSAGLADKSADFSENRCGDIWAFFVRKRLIFVKNR
jgi:hypothetical protein